MSDETTTFAQLRSEVDAFVAERDWHPFHNGKDLAMSIAIEAAELLEEYQWCDPEMTAAVTTNDEARERVCQELADVLIYCFSFSNALGIDISDAVRDKLRLAGTKYPSAEYCGRARQPGRR